MGYESLSTGGGGGEDSRLHVQDAQPSAGETTKGDLWSKTDAGNEELLRATSTTTYVSTEGGSAAHDLFSATHGDVNEAETPADGDLLQYDGVTDNAWEPKTLAEAGVAASSHTHVEADVTDLDHLIEDDVYGVGWNGDTTHAPSQNAVYDKVEAHIAASEHPNDHAEAHTVASHSDTTATGAELETLTDGSDADSLHTHNGKASTSHAASHADGGSDELAVQDLASDAATDGQVAKANGSGGVAFENDLASIQFVVDGGGSAITTGVKGYLEVPFACVITAVRLLADQTGSVVVDIWKDAYANYPPTDADTITGGNEPTISAGVKDEDTTLTSWTTTLAAGDILGFNIDSVATITRLTISITVRKT